MKQDVTLDYFATGKTQGSNQPALHLHTYMIRNV